MKNILITGASGLIGASISNYLGSNHNIIKSDISMSESIVHLDVTDSQNIAEVFAKYQFDTVIHCAYPKSANFNRDFLLTTFEDFNENLNIQLGGSFNILREACKKFSQQQSGNIILVGSVSGIMNPRFDTYEGLGFTTPISYTCVKASIVSMAKYAAKYMAGKNVRVNVISPSGIFDNQNEIFVERYKNYCLNKGLLNVEDLNGALEFLVSDSSKFINGQNIVVDDGFTLH